MEVVFKLRVKRMIYFKQVSDVIHYILKRSLKLPMEEIAVVSCSSLPKSLLCYPLLSLRTTKIRGHDFTKLPRDLKLLSLNLRPTALSIFCVPSQPGSILP